MASEGPIEKAKAHLALVKRINDLQACYRLLGNAIELYGSGLITRFELEDIRKIIDDALRSSEGKSK